MVKKKHTIFGDSMKKQLKKICMLMITIFYLLFLFGCHTVDNEIRLRILANSNSDVDQQKKQEVKKYLEEYLGTEGIVLDTEEIEKKLNEIFPNENITVTRTKVGYEAKTYEGKLIPSGYYDTILITIGEGKGKNFWTLLYPEFFNISFEDDHEVEYHSFFYDLFHKE